MIRWLVYSFSFSFGCSLSGAFIPGAVVCLLERPLAEARLGLNSLFHHNQAFKNGIYSFSVWCSQHKR